MCRERKNSSFSKPGWSILFDEYIKFNKPYIKVGAVVGIGGLKKVLYNSFMILSKRKLRVCNTEEEAINFLVSETKSFGLVD